MTRTPYRKPNKGIICYGSYNLRCLPEDKAEFGELKQLIRDLCAIPAPSHSEEKRAAFCKAWFG